jgi:hypothetical protein
MISQSNAAAAATATSSSPSDLPQLTAPPRLQLMSLNSRMQLLIYPRSTRQWAQSTLAFFRSTNKALTAAINGGAYANVRRRASGHVEYFVHVPGMIDAWTPIPPPQYT